VREAVSAQTRTLNAQRSPHVAEGSPRCWTMCILAQCLTLCRSLAILRARIKDREARQVVFNSFCSDQRTRLGRLLQK
jgi:hypothetical protein